MSRVLISVLIAVLLSAASPAQRALGDAPRPLSTGVHPFIDRSLITDMNGVNHLLHRPAPREVVLVMDRPWEGRMSGYGTVLRDAQGRVRLYYRGGGDIDPPEVSCVALSDDGGVTFARPDLGLYKVRGTRENNVVFTASDRPSYGESHNFAPFLDASPNAPTESRWKAVALKTDKDEHGEKHKMLTVLGSADGLRWKHLAERPVIRKGSFDSLNIAFFDAHRQEYACYFRVGINGQRSFARAHSSDFLNWTIDEAIAFRPAQDEQWYTNGVTPYPGVPGLYLALPMRFVPQRKTVGDPPRKTDGLSDAVMMSSRDGLVWDRTFREAFIRPGPDPNNWGDAHGNNTPLAGVIETSATEWSVYWFENGVTGTPRIRRGALRPHGLGSVRGGADGGEFVTPPLRLEKGGGRSLRLNYATSALGSVAVAVLDADGNPIEGFGIDDCAEIYGDEPARVVSWQGGRTLPQDAVFQLRFRLKDADLYALVIE